MLKHFRVNRNSLRIHLKEYSDNPALCPCSTLKRYIERTFFLQGEVTQLFLSFNKSHLLVSCDTISRWLRVVLYEAGIDTVLFKAHSTRAAASSAAKESWMPVDDILNIAGWSNAHSFKKLYDKTVC